jgi:RHS repeat-associated protein
MFRFAGFVTFCSIILVLSLSDSLYSQVTPGFPPFAAYDAHEVDTVDLMNNNVILSVPVMSKPGAIDFGLAANSYMSAVGTWSPSMAVAVNAYTGAPFTPGAYGLLGRGGPLSVGWTTSQPGPDCSDGSQTTWLSGFSFATTDGTKHPISPTIRLQTADSDSLCHNQTLTATAIDGSGLTIQIKSFQQGSAILTTVHQRNGSSLLPGTLTDRYGNSLTQLSGCGSTSCNYQDLMGLTILSMSTPNGITKPQYAWTDVNGGAPYVGQSTTGLTLKTNFTCSGITDLNNSTTTAMTTSFSFPDSTALGLNYEGTPGSSGKYTGRIHTITLREGGTVSYTYGGTHNGIDCTYQTAPMLTRTLGNGDQTTYTLTHSLISGSSYKAVNTVLDPGGNQTIYTFTGFTSTGIAAAPTAQALTQVQRYQGTSTLLSTDVYCYNTSFSSCSFTGAPNATVTLPVMSKIVVHKMNGMSTTSATEYHYDTYGNVIYVADYDFGGTSPVRATSITYGSCSAGCNTATPTISAIGSNINSVQGEVVTTQNGSTIAQSNYTYNSSGSLLTTYVWTGSRWLSNTSPNVYNSNGSRNTTYDVANRATSYGYSSASYSSCSGCTQYPYPTSITTGGLTTTTTYNGIGGVKLSDTDANAGNTTTYCYSTGTGCSGGSADPYWRVLQKTDPLGANVVFTYPTGSLPHTSSSSFTFNGGNSVNNTTVTTDGYGRAVNSQMQQGPSLTNYDTVSTNYSWSGGYAVTQTSERCTTTSGSSCSLVHTFDYDPLGRLAQQSTTGNETVTHGFSQSDDLVTLSPAPSGENAKQTQTEYDGLGRLSKICYIGNGSSTACGQATGSLNGVSDVYTYSAGGGYTTVLTTRAGTQTAGAQYDALGRKTITVGPEGGYYYYYYDVTTSCPAGAVASSGNPVCSVDANGAPILYMYDSLNRVTDILSASYCRRFRYDNTTGVLGSIPSGITIANKYGRLVEAETDDCTVPLTVVHQITDEWFSYDKDGRVLTQWEATQYTGGYIQSTATYNLNGVPSSVTILGGTHSISYGADGEGRPSTATVDGTQVISGTSLWPSTAPYVAKVNLTNNDYDSYAFSSNTGQANSYTLAVGTASMTGGLTWNANGTLQSLAIQDQFNSGGSQTCNFNPTLATGTGYDDWTRLIGVDCGSGQWGQTFSYDSYDNLSKHTMAGRIGSSYTPTYSSSTNHASFNTYDNDGDVTNDGTYYYGWNSFGKVAWVGPNSTPNCLTDTNCITYDALGRIVQFTYYSGGTISVYQELLTPGIDADVVLSNGTLVYAIWPGTFNGSIYELSSGNLYYMHRDWIGSARIAHAVKPYSSSGVFDVAYSPYGEQYDVFNGLTSLPIVSFAGLSQDFMAGTMWDTPNRELSAVGRWLSPDPIRGGWNAYAYAGSNPLSYIDPLGLRDCLALDGTVKHNCPEAPDRPDAPTGGDDGSSISQMLCKMFGCGPHFPMPYQLLSLLGEIYVPQHRPAGNKGKNCPSATGQAINKVLLNAALVALNPGGPGLSQIPQLAGGGVFQIGLGGSAVIGDSRLSSIGIAAYSGSVSLAFDKYGNVGLVFSGAGVGNGLGVGAVGGLQISTSPAADNIFQLSGRTFMAGTGGGAGVGGAVDYSWGSTPGGTISETIGAGTGGMGVSGQAGWTYVVPLVCK